MDENSFVNPNSTWKPPAETPNPYRQAKIVKQVVEVAPMVIPFPTANSTKKICLPFQMKILTKLLTRFSANSRSVTFAPNLKMLPEIIFESTEQSSTANFDESMKSKNFFRIMAGSWSATRCATFRTAAPIVSAVSVFRKFLRSEWRLFGKTACKS